MSANSESLFRFLNRVDNPIFGLVRDQLDEWYARFPEAGKPAARATFRSDDRRQTLGAFWELYLFELFRRLGPLRSVGLQIVPDLLEAHGSTPSASCSQKTLFTR